MEEVQALAALLAAKPEVSGGFLIELPSTRTLTHNSIAFIDFAFAGVLRHISGTEGSCAKGSEAGF
jgi:hypothetical protein